MVEPVGEGFRGGVGGGGERVGWGTGVEELVHRAVNEQHFLLI